MIDLPDRPTQPNRRRAAALRFDAAVDDLRLWAILTGRQLPYSPEQIALLEQVGAVVDLLTGEIFVPEEVML